MGCCMNNMIPKRCACCGSENIAYIPLPAFYLEEVARYGAPPSKNEMVNQEEYSCPRCFSADRDRAYAVWMKRELKSDQNLTILDIAPSPAISYFIQQNFPLAHYITVDMYMPHVDYHLDIMNMWKIKSSSIDFFICSHVLEHVKNDIQAMRELYRVLKKDGCGICVVPMDLNQTFIDEDSSCTDIGERWRRFGQDDQLRKYSKQGYLERLQSVGFVVTEYKKDYFGPKAMYENSLTDTVDVYVVSKNSG